MPKGTAQRTYTQTKEGISTHSSTYQWGLEDSTIKQLALIPQLLTIRAKMREITKRHDWAWDKDPEAIILKEYKDFFNEIFDAIEAIEKEIGAPPSEDKAKLKDIIERAGLTKKHLEDEAPSLSSYRDYFDYMYRVIIKIDNTIDQIIHEATKQLPLQDFTFNFVNNLSDFINPETEHEARFNYLKRIFQQLHFEEEEATFLARTMVDIDRIYPDSPINALYMKDIHSLLQNFKQLAAIEQNNIDYTENQLGIFIAINCTLNKGGIRAEKLKSATDIITMYIADIIKETTSFQDDREMINKACAVYRIAHFQDMEINSLDEFRKTMKDYGNLKTKFLALCKLKKYNYITNSHFGQFVKINFRLKVLGVPDKDLQRATNILTRYIAKNYKFTTESHETNIIKKICNTYASAQKQGGKISKLKHFETFVKSTPEATVVREENNSATMLLSGSPYATPSNTARQELTSNTGNNNQKQKKGNINKR